MKTFGYDLVLATLNGDSSRWAKLINVKKKPKVRKIDTRMGSIACSFYFLNQPAQLGHVHCEIPTTSVLVNL